MRHILSLSGGKDSTALAVYLAQGKWSGDPNGENEYEYVFCDTHEELPETYEYLDKIEKVLGIKIVRVSAGKTFRQLLEEVHGGYLPSPVARWCTREMKIKPFMRYVGKDEANSYLGLRGEETGRKGMRPIGKNLRPVYPFVEDNIKLPDVISLLVKSGLGLPKYYKWRTRSGCTFCFFQRSVEWVGLHENHPELFEEAKKYEKADFTWQKGKGLQWIVDQKEAIKLRAKKRAERLGDKDEWIGGCDMCHL